MGVIIDLLKGAMMHKHKLSDVPEAQVLLIHNKGFYANPILLGIAYPTANSGDFAIVGTTDTFWVWDADTTNWVNSGSPASTPPGYTKSVFTNVTSVTVVHNFGVEPLVQCIDSTGFVFIPYSIEHVSLNSFVVTFSTTKSGSVIASMGGPQPQVVTNVGVNYIITLVDKTLNVTTAGVEITLLTAVGNKGYEFIIDNASNGDITLKCTGAETINGVATITIASNNSYSVYSNGTEWRIK